MIKEKIVHWIFLVYFKIFYPLNKEIMLYQSRICEFCLWVPCDFYRLRSARHDLFFLILVLLGALAKYTRVYMWNFWRSYIYIFTSWFPSKCWESTVLAIDHGHFHVHLQHKTLLPFDNILYSWESVVKETNEKSRINVKLFLTKW